MKEPQNSDSNSEQFMILIKMIFLCLIAFEYMFDQYILNFQLLLTNQNLMEITELDHSIQSKACILHENSKPTGGTCTQKLQGVQTLSVKSNLLLPIQSWSNYDSLGSN